MYWWKEKHILIKRQTRRNTLVCSSSSRHSVLMHCRHRHYRRCSRSFELLSDRRTRLTFDQDLHGGKTRFSIHLHSAREDQSDAPVEFPSDDEVSPRQRERRLSLIFPWSYQQFADCHRATYLTELIEKAIVLNKETNRWNRHVGKTVASCFRTEC